jgi:hypothetical protein
MLLWKRCEATQAAPPTTPVIAPTNAAEPTFNWPEELKIGGYVSGGVAKWIGTVSNVPICQITPFSVQPMHGTPVPIGHTPGISLKWRVAQAACVTGPLQPSL